MRRIAKLYFSLLMKILLILSFNCSNFKNVKYFDLSVSTLNCHGLKTNVGYVKDLTDGYCVNFICETWLQPHELATVASIFEDENKWCHLQSSMDTSVLTNGRPYGGLGYICQKRASAAYQIINSDSDRVCALNVIQDGHTVVTLVGVYLPFHDGSSEQAELYMDTLFKIQCLIDSCCDVAPVMVIGDFNMSLPKTDYLQNNWQRCRPYNRNSVLLYNFIQNNDFIVADDQSVSFTYSNSITSTYIDHILVPQYLIDMITNCDILEDNVSNMSDHYAICVSLRLPLYDATDRGPDSGAIQYLAHSTIRPKWKDPIYEELYVAELSKALQDVTLSDLSCITHEGAVTYI